MPRAEASSAAGVSLLTFASVSGACTQTVKVGSGFTLTPTPGADGSCVIASLAPGATATITKTYTVDPVSVQNANQTLRTSGYKLVSSGSHGVSDPNPDNDVADTATVSVLLLTSPVVGTGGAVPATSRAAKAVPVGAADASRNGVVPGPAALPVNVVVAAGTGTDSVNTVPIRPATVGPVFDPRLKVSV